jgi:hypothetical protein
MSNVADRAISVCPPCSSVFLLCRPVFLLKESSQMQPEKRAKKSRFKIEMLEERIAPAHLNPGVGEVVLPAAASQGARGIETSLEAPASHTKLMLILTES